MVFHLCLHGIDIHDIDYSVILPDTWDEDEVKERFHCRYDKAKNTVTVTIDDICGDPVLEKTYDMSSFGSEVLDFSSIDDGPSN